MKFEVASHDPPLKRIDISKTPKSAATMRDEFYINVMMERPPASQPYVNATERDRIWKLVEQFSVTSGDTSEIMERNEPEGLRPESS